MCIQNVNKIHTLSFIIYFSVYFFQDLANFLTDDHIVLKNMLNKIPAVSMVVVNLYFDKNILPVEV